MESKWSGDAENAFFNGETFNKCRELLQAEKEYSGRSSKSAYYVLGIDVGRRGCQTEICVLKVTPQPQGASLKSVVNLFSFADMDFEAQAIEIKKLYYLYHAQRISIDGNGLGIGLLDFMIKAQIDPETNDTLPPFGVDNDEDGFYKKYITPETERDAMYVIKANAPINTEMYSYVQTQLSSGKVKFLIDQRQAKTKLLSTKIGQAMSIEQRNDYLRPYVMTDILREQLLNLAEENEGVNIILKQVSRGIPKDKFSAFGYGMYYIKQEEERKKRRKKFNIADFMFMN